MTVVLIVALRFQIYFKPIIIFLSVNSSTTCIFKRNFNQIFQDGIEALRVSYKKMNPFCIPFATTNIGSALLAMDLVSLMPMFVEILAVGTIQHHMLLLQPSSYF